MPLMLLKKRWKLDYYFFEAGYNQVMPVWLDKTLDKKAAQLWLRKIKKDRNFSKQIVGEMLNIIETEKELVKSVPQKQLSLDEVEKYILKHLGYWVKYFELGFLWFCIEKIQEETNQEIKRQWKEGDKNLEIFLETVYRPMKFPPSSVEQRDLLKVVSLKGDALDVAVNKHWLKYRHLSLHNIDDEYFDLKYYKKRIIQLQKSKIEYKKVEQTIKRADLEIKQASEVIKRSKVSKELQERINLVRWFMYARTASIDYMMQVNGAYKTVFSSFANSFNITIDQALQMTVDEIVESIRKKKLVISKKVLGQRSSNGHAYLIAPHGSYLVFDKDIDKLRSVVIKEKKQETVTEFKGQSAFKGKVVGIARVIMDRRDANQLKAGEILVTTMTSPEFVPAMKISSGIITNEGGVLCHAAIMSREFRKPCIIGSLIATDSIKTGDKLKVDANQGIVKILKRD